jgi:uncharacterized membrane protein
MVASEARLNARKDLKGKWGKAALITLVYFIIVFLINYVLELLGTIGSLILAVISVPISFGIVSTFMDLKRGEETSYFQFFTDGFKSFVKAWKITLWTLVKLIVPLILIILSGVLVSYGTTASILNSAISVSTTGSASAATATSTGSILGIIGIILFFVATIWYVAKYYLYVLSFYILKDNPEMCAKEIVEESERLMKGNRCSLIWLQITFIGWAILAACTLGIGCLWLAPYFIVAQIVFYEDLTNRPFSNIKENSEANETIQEF